MRLNTLKPAPGAHQDATRVGRGTGSGKGKTAGRGHKGQKSRAGGKVRLGFEGGQMPMQRRLPKFGFHSRKALSRAEVRLGELAKVNAEVIDLEALIAADLINHHITTVKVIASGAIDKPVVVRGIGVTRGARAAIEAAGGKVEA